MVTDVLQSEVSGEIILSDLLCGAPQNSTRVSARVYVHSCTPACCCGRRVDVSLIMWRRTWSARAAQMVSRQGSSSVTARRLSALTDREQKIKDAWYVECRTLEKTHIQVHPTGEPHTRFVFFHDVVLKKPLRGKRGRNVKASGSSAYNIVIK